MAENQPNLNVNFPGIRLYVEDPQVAIRRQIKKTLYIAVIVLVLGAGIMLYLTSSIKKSGANLAAKETLINTALGQQSVDPNSEKFLEEMKPILGKVQNALPTATDLLGYQGALEETAKDSGVQISVTFSPPTKTTSNLKNQANYSSIEHNLTVKGTMENIITFVEKLENLPYYVQIANFKFSTSQDGTSSGSLALKIFTAPGTVTASPTPQNSPSSLQ